MGDNSSLQTEARSSNYGFRIGCFCRKNWLNILIGVLLFWFIVMIMQGLDACESQNASVSAVIRHMGCKGNGGCGDDCPYLNTSDPRYLISRNLRVAKTCAGYVNEANGDIEESIQDVINKETDAVQAELSTSVSSARKTMAVCAGNIFAIVTKMEDLKAMYSKSDPASPQMYDAQNRAAALEAAAIVNLKVASIASMDISAILKDHKIKNLTESQRSKIHDFEKEYTKAVMAKTSIVAAYQFALTQIAAGAAPSADGTATVLKYYPDQINAIMTNETDYQQVLSAMAGLINKAQEMDAADIAARAEFAKVNKLYQKALSFEGFNNSLPGLVPSDEMSSLIVENDYNTALIKTALEPEIVSNHQKFANERMAFDSGGGVPSVRDDDNDINPWVGLFGRPTYKKTDGTSADVSSEPLRSIPSTDPNSLMRARTPRMTF